MPLTSTIAPGAVQAAAETLRADVAAQCDATSVALQARMRAVAGWTDRNGPSLTGRNARDSLQTTVVDDGASITIIAYSDRQALRPWREWGDGAPVGLFLERGTRHMRAYPAIWPSTLAAAQALKASLGG